MLVLRRGRPASHAVGILRRHLVDRGPFQHRRGEAWLYPSGLLLANETGWDSDDLAAFIEAGIEGEGMEPRRYVRVIHYSGGGVYYAGLGRYDGRAARLSVPSPVQVRSLDVKKSAQLLSHEFAHNRGLRHKDMMDWWDLDVSWADPWVSGERRLRTAEEAVR